MLKNELNINLIQNQTDTSFCYFFYLGFIGTQTCEYTVAYNSKVVLNYQLHWVEDLHNCRYSICAHLYVGLYYLLAYCVKEVSCWPELNKLMRVFECYLLYLFYCFYPFLPVWTAASLKNRRYLSKFCRELWDLCRFSFCWRSLNPFYSLWLLRSLLSQSHAFGL